MITKRVSTWACALTLASVGYGQIDWHANPGGNTISAGEWFGADGSSTIPLQIRHDAADYPIEFYTAGDFRARINPRITYGSLGSFSSIPAHGFALITPNNSFFNTVKGPFTRLHLADGGAGNDQQLAFRPWMSNGVTFTGNFDHGYVGQKYREEEDYTDMVVHWSDNPGNERMDRLRFLFTSGYDQSAPTGAQSWEGLEGMRLWPKDLREVNVGVGDFYADGTEPSERLHVLNGRVRIEELPSYAPAVGLTKVVVVDDAFTDERGVLKWMDITDLVPADCEWTMSGGGQNNLSTAFGAVDPACPDVNDAVGIGLDLGASAATARMNILNQASASSMTTGVKVEVDKTGAANGLLINTESTSQPAFGIDAITIGSGTGPAGLAFGARFDVTGTSGGQSTRGVQGLTRGSCVVAIAGDFHAYDNANNSFGVQGVSYDGILVSTGVQGLSHALANKNIGMLGMAGNSGSIPLPAAKHTGVYGLARSDDEATVCYGVIGYTTGPDDLTGTFGHTKWAGFFPGNTYTPGSVWSASDPQLKQNVTDLVPAEALERMLQLEPKEYDFDRAGYAYMGLPSEHQFGLISTQVEEIFPSLVTRVIQPGMTDSSGVEVSPAIDFKALNYQGLIPVLIAAMQEQNDRIDHLEQALAACCANPDGSRMQDQGFDQPNELNNDFNGSEKLRIQPNPFNERTTVFYTLDRGGRTQLLANSSDGRDLRVLQEANLEAGSYQYDWDTAALAPGMYYVTLLLDGQPVVKKVVKVDR